MKDFCFLILSGAPTWDLYRLFFSENNIDAFMGKLILDVFLIFSMFDAVSVNGTRCVAGNVSASAFLTDTEVTLTGGGPSHRGGASHPSSLGGAPYVNGLDTGERELLPWCPEVSDTNNGDDDLMGLDDHVSWLSLYGLPWSKEYMTSLYVARLGL